MTKEELKQEAEESFEQYKVTDEDYVVSPYSDDMGEKMLMYNYEYYAEETYLRLYTQGYLASAEPREKRITELKYQLTHRNCLDCSNHSSKLRMRNLDLEKENAELKEEINKIAFARGNLEKGNAELKEELKKWKDEWQEQVQKATDEGYARTLQTIQLTKAKELLKQFLNAKNGEDTYKAEWEAEQFLKDSGVEK